MTKDVEREVLTAVDHLAPEIVRSLQAMLRFETITPEHGSSVQDDAFVAHQRWVERFLVGRGFATEMWDVDVDSLEDGPGRGLVPDRDMRDMPVVIGHLAGAGEGRSLILNGHYDVVPPGDRSAWRFPPFSGLVRDGRVFGRGAVDMKGGIAAMLHAVQAVQSAGFALAGDLTVQVVPDEEATCMGTLACCMAGHTADAAIIPEPTDMKVLVAMRGSVYGTVQVPGRAGHAEMLQPDWRDGGPVNAITKSARIIHALDELSRSWRSDPERHHPLVGPDTLVPTLIRGGEWDVTYPESVHIRFGAMFAPGRRPPVEDIRSALVEAARTDPWLSVNLPSVEIHSWHYGAEVSPDEPIVRLAQGVLSDHGYSPDLIGFGSLTDAIHHINLASVPSISVGPATGSMHAVNESISVHELVELTRLLAVMIVRWCGVVRTGK